MILNTLAILGLLEGSVRALLALFLLLASFRLARHWPTTTSADERSLLEARFYSLGFVGLVLVVLDVIAWPLFYLLLASFVPYWPDVMCVYGVTQIGSGSVGASRYLPALVTLVETLRPAVVFASIVWTFYYLVNRRTASSPFVPKLCRTMVVLSALALLDAAAECAYLVIPKIEHTLASGCCTALNERSTRLASAWQDQIGPNTTLAVTSATLVLTAAFAGIGANWSRMRQSQLVLGIAPLVGLVALGNGLWLLRDVLAPQLLHMPLHHCLYCLAAQVPESMVTLLLLCGGAMALGTASLLEFVRCAETQTHVATLRTALWQGAFWALSGFGAMSSWEWWLAR